MVINLDVKFPRPVIVSAVSFSALTTPQFINYQIQASLDGVTFNIPLTSIQAVVAGFQTFTFNNSVAYSYIQFYGIGSIPASTGAGLNFLQYYGVQT